VRLFGRRVVPVLAVLSGALWLAVAITMSAFADGAGNVDEGVNVQALYLTLPALTLTIATFVVAGLQQQNKPPDGPDSKPPT
jgi:hypothetical protein